MIRAFISECLALFGVLNVHFRFIVFVSFHTQTVQSVDLFLVCVFMAEAFLKTVAFGMRYLKVASNALETST